MWAKSANEFELTVAATPNPRGPRAPNEFESTVEHHETHGPKGLRCRPRIICNICWQYEQAPAQAPDFFQKMNDKLDRCMRRHPHTQGGGADP